MDYNWLFCNFIETDLDMTEYTIITFCARCGIFKFIVLCLFDELKDWDQEIDFLATIIDYFENK